MALCTCCDHILATEPTGLRLPCDWVVNGVPCPEPATHVHEHNVRGMACSHLACPLHALVDDGQHTAHRIKDASPILNSHGAQA